MEQRMTKEYKKIYNQAQKQPVEPREVGRLLIKDMLTKLRPSFEECGNKAIAEIEPFISEQLTQSEVASLTESTTAPWIACFSGLFHLRERYIRLVIEAENIVHLVTLAMLDLKHDIDNNTINKTIVGRPLNVFRAKRQEIVERLAQAYAIGLYCDMLSRNTRIPYIKEIITANSYGYSFKRIIEHYNNILNGLKPDLVKNEHVARMFKEQEAIYKDGKLLRPALEEVQPIEYEYDTSYLFKPNYNQFNIEQILSLEGLMYYINRLTIEIFIPNNLNLKHQPIGGKTCYNEAIKA